MSLLYKLLNVFLWSNDIWLSWELCWAINLYIILFLLQVVPILRAGLALTEHASSILPATKTYHLGRENHACRQSSSGKLGVRVLKILLLSLLLSKYANNHDNWLLYWLNSTRCDVNFYLSTAWLRLKFMSLQVFNVIDCFGGFLSVLQIKGWAETRRHFSHQYIWTSKWSQSWKWGMFFLLHLWMLK